MQINRIRVLIGIFTMAVAMLAIPQHASAYIGPGAGISAVGTVITLLFAVILTIVGFVWFPIKRAISRRRSARTKNE